MFLAVVGVGAWVFRRRFKVSGGETGRDHLDDAGRPVGAVTTLSMRLYVRFFALLSNFLSDQS